MRHSHLRIMAVVATLMVVAACGSTSTTTASRTYKVGLVTDIGGLNDKSFNHLAAVGLAKAASSGNICSSLHCSGDFAVKGDVVESHTGDDYVPNLTNFASLSYDLVIGVGFLMQQAVGTVSGTFPNVHFAIIDGSGTDAQGNDLHHTNVESLYFSEQDAGAMVGALSGMLEKQGKAKKNMGVISAVGGISIPPVDRYIAGYIWGATHEDPSIKVLVGYSNDFTDPTKCAGIAASQINTGNSDIVFQVAGGCGNGALTQAGKLGVYSIGVDADEAGVDNSVIASALKKVDVATYTAIKNVVNGQYSAGTLQFDIKNGGAGYQIDNLTIGSDIQAELTSLMTQIQNGTQTPPTAKTWSS